MDARSISTSIFSDGPLPLSRTTATEFNFIIHELRILEGDIRVLSQGMGSTLGEAHREALELQLDNLHTASVALENRFSLIGIRTELLQTDSACAHETYTAVSTLDLTDKIGASLGNLRSKIRAAIQIVDDLDDRDTRRLMRACLSLLIVSSWIIKNVRKVYAKRVRELAELCFATEIKNRRQSKWHGHTIH